MSIPRLSVPPFPGFACVTAGHVAAMRSRGTTPNWATSYGFTPGGIPCGAIQHQICYNSGQGMQLGPGAPAPAGLSVLL